MAVAYSPNTVKKLVSITSQVRGIKFYPGYVEFKNAAANGGLLHVDLVREQDNPYDTNAILVMTRSGTPKVLGHLEKEVAAAVARILDRELPYVRMKRYNYCN